MQAVSSILQSNDVGNNLGVTWTRGSCMDRQVSKLCQVCYFHRTVRALIVRQWITTYVSPRLRHESGLQSVLNSAARLVPNIPKFSNISAAIRDELHWLPIRRRIDFKIALMVQHCMVGTAPEYLTELCHPVSSAVGRQCLRSVSRSGLVVPRFRLQTFGHRAFAISGPQIWNSLLLKIRQSCDNLLLFKQKLKAHLIQQFWELLWIHI